MKNNNKVRRITIRFTTDEYQGLKKQIQKTGLTDAEFLRRLIFSEVDRIPNKKDTRLLNYVILSMGQANNNINQIAKALNGMLKSGERRFSSVQQQNINNLLEIINQWSSVSKEIVR